MHSIAELIQAAGEISAPHYKQRTDEEICRAQADSFNAAEGQLNEEDGYSCSLCLNKGIIMRAVQTDSGAWTTAVRDCRCRKTRRSIRLMHRSGLKNIIRDYTFERFRADEDWQKQIRAAAEAYAKDPQGWFFVGGQSGAGKTHICTAICRELLLRGREVRYMLWRDEAVRLKALVTDPEAYSRSMDELKRAEVLYIDDLFKCGSADGGHQRPTAADINIAFELLNARYADREKLTVISSECTMRELLEVDEATAGRIAERAQVISIGRDPGKNHRLQGSIEC